MKQKLIAIALLLALASAAHGFGLGLGNREGELGSFGPDFGGGGGGGCSNKLDFSQSCNSQYIALVH